MRSNLKLAIPFALALIVFLAFPLRAEEPAPAPSAPPAKMTLTIDGEELTIVKQNDILAVVE